MNATERLDEIQARADAATDGPWEAYFGIHGDPFVVRDLRRVKFTQVAEVSKAADDYGRADALFIAAARQDVPALVNALRAVLDVHREAICGTEATGEQYPCPTVRAIESALGDAS